MKPTLCSRCKKNLAVIFITKMENGQTTNEGLCLKCAKELGIKPVDDMISRMGLSDDDLENLNGEMGDMMNGLEGLLNPGEKDEDGEDDEQDSQTATFPFLNKLFGNAANNENADNLPARDERRQIHQIDLFALQLVGDIFVDDALREPLGDGRLADARLADQAGVVLLAAV